MANNPETSKRAKVRGALPGDSWREHVSEGAKRAYDGPLAPQREEAAKLRRRGRMLKAHETEKASYKIRVRGHDRRYSGDVAKALTLRTTRLGPYRRTERTLRLRRPSRVEQTTEQIKAVGAALGPARLLAGVGVGAGVTDAIKDARDKGKSMGQKVLTKVPDHEDRTLVARTKKGADEVGKSADSLVEIAKAFGAVGGLGRRYLTAATQGYKHGGATGALNAAGRTYERTGGVGGALNAVRADTPSWAPKAAGTAAALAGTGAAAYGAKKLAGHVAKPMKRKALKYAGYGAAGLGGTVAAGTALGNTLSN